MQCDEVGEVIFVQPLGREPRRAEMFHGNRLPLSRWGVEQH
jgi:hypothetical protein